MKTALGLMSGTSMDGIDIALVKTDGENAIEFGPSLAVDYTPDTRQQITQGLIDALSIKDREERPGELGKLETVLTNLHADAVNQFLKANRLSPEEIHLIGFHGQTVLHRPDEALSVQLGDGQALANQTGIDVVYDMRAADMVAGGQGAPLVPVFHQALASGATSSEIQSPVCFVNIGGISNITYIDGDDLIAFDTGPGNALIDQWMQEKAGIPFDQGGRIASEGQVHKSIAQRYLAASFFEQSGPKSLDRNDFLPLAANEANLADGARTLAHVTAASIIKAVDHLPKAPKTWIICGGGRLNDIILSDLTTLAQQAGGADTRVMISDDIDLQGDMLEAQAFAYLAVRSERGLPLTFPATTGCKHPTTGGLIARHA